MFELDSKASVEAWLNARPEATRHQDALILASRAALRTLPYISYDLAEKTSPVATRVLVELTIISLRATAVTRLMALAPSHAVANAANAAALSAGSSAAYSAKGPAGLAARSAAVAAHSVGSSADPISPNQRIFSNYVLSADTSADAAAAAASSIDLDSDPSAYSAFHTAEFIARSAVWAEVGIDARLIDAVGADDGITSPLCTAQWGHRIQPHWATMKQFLQSMHSNPPVWIDWYERVMRGGSVSLAEEEAYVLLDAQEIWDQGADAINDAITERLERLSSLVSLEAEKNNVEAGSGATIVIENDQALLKPVVDEADSAAIDDPVAQQLHIELLKALPEFVDQARRYGNKEGWKGIDTTAQEYAALVQSGLADIARNVARFWTLSSKVGTFINQDDDLRAGRLSFAEPLDPDVRRTLVNVLIAGAPLVRRFPTGLTLDEDHLRWNQPRDLSAASISLIQNAKQQQVLQAQSADIIADAIEVGTKDGVQATKSRGWAGRMVRAFVIAAFLGATGGIATKVGEKIVDKSELVRRFTEFLLSEEKRILQLTEGLPPDLAAKLRELLRRMREGNTPPPPTVGV